MHKCAHTSVHNGVRQRHIFAKLGGKFGDRIWRPDLATGIDRYNEGNLCKNYR